MAYCAPYFAFAARHACNYAVRVRCLVHLSLVLPPLFMSSARPSPNRSVLSVQELVGGLTRVIEEAYSDVWVEGELSNFSRAASGHCYFTLKDGDAQISCVMWRHLTKYVFFEPEDGLQVQLHGDASVYERRGDLQLMVRSMRLAGKGALQEAFEELKRALKAEGLFDADRKQTVPTFPETIGIVTSGQGAVPGSCSGDGRPPGHCECHCAVQRRACRSSAAARGVDRRPRRRVDGRLVGIQ